MRFPSSRTWPVVLVAVLLALMVPQTSEDAAATDWSTPYIVASGSVEAYMEMAVEGDHVYTVYVQQIRDEYYVYLRWYDGTSWSSALRVSERTSTDSTDPAIDVANGVAHIAYVDRTDGDNDVKYTSFNGTAFTVVQQVSNDLGRMEALDPDIAVDGSTVHIVWEEWILSDSDIYHRSLVAGRWTSIQELSTDNAAEQQVDPSVAADDGKVHVVWADIQGTDRDLTYRQWTGTLWDGEVNLNPAIERNSDKNPHVDAFLDDVYVAYESWPSMSASEVHMVAYEDGRWGQGTLAVTLAGNEMEPRVAAEHGHMALTFRSVLAFSSAYFQHWNGTGWEPAEVISSGSANTYYYPTDVDLVGGRAHVSYVEQGMTSRNHVYTAGDLDLKDPQAAVDPVDPYWMDARRNTLGWTALDDYGLDRVVVQYRYSADNVTWDRWTEIDTAEGLSSKTAAGNVSFVPADGDGYYEFKAYAVDVTGKGEPPSIEPEAMGGLDTANPTGSIVINGGDDFTDNSTVSLTLTHGDAMSGVAAVRFGEESIGGDEPWENPVETRPWTIGTEEGEYTVAYQVMDHAGLISSIYTDTIYLDLADPYGTINMTVTGEWTTTRDVTLELTYGDTGSGVSMVRFADEAVGGDEPWENPVDTRQWTLPEGEGTHTVAYQVMDAAGRTSEVYTVSIGLDTVAPTGSIIIEGGDTFASDRTVHLTLSSEEETSGVVGIRVSNEAIGGDEPWENKVETREWDLLEGSGERTVYYQVIDAAGHVSEVYSDSVILDTDEPWGALGIPSGLPKVRTREVTITVSGDDATTLWAGFRMSSDGIWDTEEWQDPAESTIWTLSEGDGEKTVYYQVIDEAGQVSQTYTLTVTLDTIAPYVVSTDPEDGEEDVDKDAPVVITFSEAMNETSVESAITIMYSVSFDPDWTDGTSFEWSPDGKRVTFRPNRTGGKWYQIKLLTHARDLASNPIPSNVTFEYNIIDSDTNGDGGDGNGDDGGTPWGLIVGLLVVICAMAAVIAFLLLRKRSET